ncbi:CULLIN-2 domain-containing protein [Mycena venus]|uniref:CULLIN-2 domain-containing protein n=1 Tax=Mycena venus TaxID=2733690 RepID=A0A8H6YH06_9AGAR|nr:CULLIN-2 domain-containing protein [Mycena venus]
MVSSESMPAWSADLASIWSFLENGIDNIMSTGKPSASYAKHMSLYTVVLNYCTSSKLEGTSANHAGGIANRTGAQMMGADLYNNLIRYFVQHLKNLREKSYSLQDEDLLQYYAGEWERYSAGAKYIDRVFVTLNRHWIKRERDEGRKGVYPVYTLALVQWKNNLFLPVQRKHRKLTSAILRLIELQRTGKTIDQGLVQKVLDSMVSLGLDAADLKKKCLNVYKEHFEIPFIDATEQYYRNESAAFLAKNGLSNYLKKVEERLREEEDRVQQYLDPGTHKPLITKCEHVLIQEHSELMWDNFQTLLYYDKDEDLQRMYALLYRIPEGLEPLHKKFEEHVKKSGLAAVAKHVGKGENAAGERNGAAPYVDALLDVHQKNAATVARNFKGDAGFAAALEKAYREVVNGNEATGVGGVHRPELLVEHVEMTLTESNKMTGEDDLEGARNRVVRSFSPLPFSSTIGPAAHESVVEESKEFLDHGNEASINDGTIETASPLHEDSSSVWLIDFTGHQVPIPWRCCQSWQDLCVFLDVHFEGKQESRFIEIRSFGIHIPKEKDLLSHESWDSWVSASNNDLKKSLPTLELYAIMKDDSNRCPHCDIMDPATEPLTDLGHQKCLVCKGTFLERFEFLEPSQSTEQEVVKLDGQTYGQTPELSVLPTVATPPLESLSARHRLEQNNSIDIPYSSAPSATANFGASSTTAVEIMLSAVPDAHSSSVAFRPQRLQVIRSRLQSQRVPEVEQPSMDPAPPLPAVQVLPVSVTPTLSLTIESPGTSSKSFFHNIYKVAMLGLPDRYLSNSPQPQTSLDSDITKACNAFYKRCSNEWREMGRGAAVLFSLLFTILQISSAAYDPVVRAVVQLSIVCLFFGSIYAFILSAMFGKLEQAATGPDWMLCARRAPTDTLWNPWIMLSLPLSWIIWGVFYFATFIMAFLWRSGATDEPDENSRPSKTAAYGPRIVTTLMFAAGTVYLGLVIVAARKI